MSTLSLKEKFEWLERELPPNPPVFRIHDDLPFAILQYDPGEEWIARRELRRLEARLRNKGLNPVRISLADILWEAVRESEGLETLVSLEQQRGFAVAQEQINVYLSDPDFTPLPQSVAARLEEYEPSKTVCFLWRAASLSPSLYHVSKLLEEMQGLTSVPTVLLYPGLRRGTNSLQFMGLSSRDATGNYRVKIYG